MKPKLSDRLRDVIEAPQWVIDEVKKLEAELETAQAFHRVAVKERDYERRNVEHLQACLNRRP